MTHTVPRPDDQAEALRPADWDAAWLERMASAASRAHAIEADIGRAAKVASLRDAAGAIDELLPRLHADGVRAHLMAKLLQRLHTKLFARLWSLLTTPDLVDRSCLMVMGSEGRGEQTAKTDQDNALLLRDERDVQALEAVAARFSEALAEFGYPPCPGGIMVTNPLWRQTLPGFRETLRGWLFDAEPEGPMRLAIFLDATTVAGDPALLAEARADVTELLAGNDAFMARFAAAADQFREDAGWWRRLGLPLGHAGEEVDVDLKKLGTFPIVHGVRSLALRHGVHDVGTADRLRSLAAAGHVQSDVARDLAEALHVLMDLKLGHNLRQALHSVPADNRVRLDGLGTMARQALRAALSVVHDFRRDLRRDFKLDTL